MLKNKKDKIVTFFSKFVGFYYFRVPQELRISDILLAILLTNILIDNRNGAFYLYQKQRRQKITNKQGRAFSAKNNTPLFLYDY